MQGRVGLVLNSAAFYPKDPQDTDDVAAARRVLDFQLHWFLQPVTAGDYPEVMRQAVGHRLPAFSHEQRQRLKGSIDVLGLNYYMSQLATPGRRPINEPPPPVRRHSLAPRSRLPSLYGDPPPHPLP